MAEVTELENNECIRAATSAFSKGKDQTLNNTNVLNASGNITYVECSTQITQAIVDALLNGLTSNARLSGIPNNISAPISNENSIGHEEDDLLGTSDTSKTSSRTTEDISTVNPESEVDLEGGRSVSVDETESNSSVNMIASYESLFIPEETLSRFPNGQEVYVQKLFPLQYGFPLWFPQPSRNLPLEYRRKGISVGDVGAIMSTGNFHFLFNISLPAGHPINPNDLPDDFVHLPEDKLRSESHDSFNPGHSAVSNLDIISDQDENTNDIVITCQDGNKGAILSIPDGASDEDLVNEWDLKEFISKNALTWYRYARHCGLELNHHSLYLVTGHMKSKSWGIATFNKAAPERNAVLKMSKSNTANGLPFSWRKSGGANVSRTGPSPDSGLAAENSSRMENQCLFLRGFQISLSKAMWTKMWSTSTVVPAEDSSDICREFPTNRDGVKTLDHELGSGSDGQTSTDKYIGNNIEFSRFPDRNVISHPLSVINDILLSMVPGAHISVVHERSWCQLISLVRTNHGGGQELHEIIRSQFVMGYCEKTGMCTIEPRKNASSHYATTQYVDGVESAADATQEQHVNDFVQTFNRNRSLVRQVSPKHQQGYGSSYSNVISLVPSQPVTSFEFYDMNYLPGPYNSNPTWSNFSSTSSPSCNSTSTTISPSNTAESSTSSNSTNSNSSELTYVGAVDSMFEDFKEGTFYNPTEYDSPYYSPGQFTSSTKDSTIYEQYPYPSASGNLHHGHEHLQSMPSSSTAAGAGGFEHPEYQVSSWRWQEEPIPPAGSSPLPGSRINRPHGPVKNRRASNRPRFLRGVEAPMGHDKNPTVGSTRVFPYPSPNASPRVGYNDLPPTPPGDSFIDDLNPITEASQNRRKQQATFTCPIPGCGSTFTRSFSLKGHIRSHNEDKSFECHWPGCGKRFARQHDCKRHEELHTNYRPFTCDGCQKQFARMDALNRHLRSEGGAECAKLQKQRGRASMTPTPPSSPRARRSMELPV